MNVHVLGGHGGQAKGFATTSFLIDQKLLLDAGAVTTALTVDEQSKIENILISHCHLDHTKDIAFLCDNCFGMKQKPFEVYSHMTVNKLIKTHILNDMLWPDFSVLPSASYPTVRFNDLEPEKRVHIGEYYVTPVRVNHPLDAMGYIIEKGDDSILFTVDTGPTDRIWEIAHTFKNLRAIFTEVSFPNALQNVATLSDHHTSLSLSQEIPKMPKGLPIILTHLKPGFREEIMREISELNEPRIRVLEKDGEMFNFSTAKERIA
jgi:ribonuclease BN (tRNA processing enzyme)